MARGIVRDNTQQWPGMRPGIHAFDILPKISQRTGLMQFSLVTITHDKVGVKFGGA